MKFHISDVLSVYSGYLVSTRKMEGVYETLNFLTGDNLYTHQLPRAMEECKPFLSRQYPFLAYIDCSGQTPETLSAWIANIVSKYGETLDLNPIDSSAHKNIDPILEAEEMMNARNPT